MINDLRRMNRARKWMKSNETFLPTWHAYIGYRFSLFDHFKKTTAIEHVAKREGLDINLLSCWAEAGIAVGHLKKKGKNKVKSKRSIQKQMSKQNKSSVGVLLEEMMTLHIPTLLQYDKQLAPQQFDDSGDYSKMVAETSSLLETLAFPKVQKVIRDTKAKHIIDLGCGYGGYLRRIAKKNPALTLTGVEKNEGIVEEARSLNTYKNVNIVQGDMVDAHDGELNADLVMMNNALYYFSADDRSRVFENAYRMLQKKGSFILVTPLQMKGEGKAFPAAFNSFMCGHKDMKPLPSEQEIRALAGENHFKVKTFRSVIKEGGWYFFHLVKKD